MTTTVVRPPDLAGATAALADGGPSAAPLAGGVAWMLHQARGETLPDVLVDLSRVGELRGIATTADGGLRIGAMTRLHEIEHSSLVAVGAPGLREAVATVGSVRIRQQATLGGNVAAAVPRHDPPAMLLALDARVRSTGPSGDRDMPLVPTSPEGRHAHDLIVAFELPPSTGRRAAAYRTLDVTTGARVGRVSAAVRIDLADDGTARSSRVVLVHPDDGPRRCPAAEACIDGHVPDPATVDAAGAAGAREITRRVGRDDDDDAEAMRIVIRRALEAALTRLETPA